MIPWLQTNSPFPDVSLALGPDSQAPGLLCAGADLTAERLLDAYRHGIFPWFSEGQPVLWWSTDPRMVLMTNQLVISHSLKKVIKRVDREPQHWQVRFDSAFEQVMRACAAPRRANADGEVPGTWITESIISAYCQLHQMGYAHSTELWQDGALVAGAYGVAIGRMFYGESMFTRISDGSKIALAHLVYFLRQHGVTMIDCQQETAHLASLGAAPISRTRFLAHLRSVIDAAPISEWVPLSMF